MTHDEQQTQTPTKLPSTRTRTKARGRLKVDPLYSVKFDAMRCALCHDDSERWYAFLHRMVMFLSGLTGAGSVALFLKDYPILAAASGLTVTALTTLDLVFDLSGKARLHADLKQRFYNVLAECEADGASDPRPHRARLTKIYGTEPPLSAALNHLMWNKAYQALAREPVDNDLYEVDWWCRCTRHLLSHEGRAFVTKGAKNGG